MAFVYLKRRGLWFNCLLVIGYATAIWLFLVVGYLGDLYLELDLFDDWGIDGVGPYP